MGPVLPSSARGQRRRPEGLLPGLVLALLLAVVCGPLIAAGWQTQDDHAIIRNAFSRALHPQLPGPISPWRSVLEENLPNGRVIPLSIVARFVMVKLVGASPARLHAVVLLLGWVSLFSLYSCARATGLDRFGSLLVPVLAFMAPDAFSSWYRLGTGELWGTACLTGSLACAVRARTSGSRLHDVGVVTLAVLAGLSKESFVATVPALAWFRAGALEGIVRPAPQVAESLARRTRSSVRVLLAAFFLMSALVAGVSALSDARSEGGGPLRAVLAGNVSHIGSVAFALLVVGGGWLPLLLLPLLRFRDLEVWHRTRRLFAFAGLWLAPQAFIYFDRGGPLQRFALPASVGAGLVLAVAFSRLRERRACSLAASVWLSAWLLLSGVHAIKAASVERAEAIAFGRIVDDLAAQVGRGKGVALVTSPIETERAIALITLLGLAGRPDIPVFYVRNQEVERSSDPGREWLVRLEEDLHRRLESTTFKGRTERDLDTASVDAVVFRGRADRIPGDWRRRLSAWQETDWCADYLGGNLRAGVVLATRAACNRAFVRPESPLGRRRSSSWGSDSGVASLGGALCGARGGPDRE